MNKTKKAILAGGSGFIGQAVSKALIEQGYDVTILSRQSREGSIAPSWLKWDGRTEGDWVEALEGADLLINLTGKRVDCLYNDKNKKEIVESRVNSVKILNEVCRKCSTPPKLWIQAGSLAIYGDTKDRVCEDDAVPGQGFSSDVCVAWENEFFRDKSVNTRKVLFRIGFALGKNSVALEPMEKLTKFFLGGSFGNGEQYISWLHIDDLVRIFLLAINSSDIEGVYNVTGPKPVKNKDFMRVLRKTLNRPWSPPCPAWLIQIGGRFVIGKEPELALTGRRCLPKRLMECGYTFTHTELESTLAGIYCKQETPGR